MSTMTLARFLCYHVTLSIHYFMLLNWVNNRIITSRLNKSITRWCGSPSTNTNLLLLLQHPDLSIRITFNLISSTFMFISFMFIRFMFKPLVTPLILILDILHLKGLNLNILPNQQLLLPYLHLHLILLLLFIEVTGMHLSVLVLLMGVSVSFRCKLYGALGVSAQPGVPFAHGVIQTGGVRLPVFTDGYLIVGCLEVVWWYAAIVLGVWVVLDWI